jgi:hypothetical protein
MMGKKSYCKGKVVKWAVEVGTITFELLLSILSNEVSWSSNQKATFWFIDKSMGKDVMMCNDMQFQNLFEMYKSEMHCQVILVVVDKNVLGQPEFDDLEPLCVLPHDTNPAIKPAAFSEQQLLLPYPELGMQPGPCMQPEPPYPTNPEPQSDPSMPTKSQGVAEEERDIFDNEEEYVGVNDEHMYISVPPAQPSMNAQPSLNTQSDPSMPTNATNENVTAEGAIPSEAEVNDADPDEIRVLHDPENPRIEKGALFPDIVTFRKAVRHYAVKKGFELAPGIKTDPTRYIARCKHPSCPWRIHASRIHDQKTIQV